MTDWLEGTQLRTGEACAWAPMAPCLQISCTFYCTNPLHSNSVKYVLFILLADRETEVEGFQRIQCSKFYHYKMAKMELQLGCFDSKFSVLPLTSAAALEHWQIKERKLNSQFLQGP